jgi:hypothetical protein
MTTERMIMYIGGTQEAIQFIEKYKKTGHVVDFYSDEYVEHRNKNNCAINLKLLKTLDQEHGTTYRNHLLVVYIGDQDREMLAELSSLYAPIHRYFNIDHGGLIKPDFLLLNLATKEILCVGIGRRNQEFHFELHNYLLKNTTLDAPNKINHFSKPEISEECSEVFYELDHWNLSRKLINEMKRLGTAYYEDSKRGVKNSINFLSYFAPISDIWELSDNW